MSREGSEDDPDSDALVALHAGDPSSASDKGQSSLYSTVRKDQRELLAPTDPFVNYSRPRTQQAISKEARKPVGDRRLSNMEDSEVKFRGHRDSVTLARTRMANSGGISCSRTSCFCLELLFTTF
jgi:hypothetical protein